MFPTLLNPLKLHNELILSRALGAYRIAKSWKALKLFSVHHDKRPFHLPDKIKDRDPDPMMACQGLLSSKTISGSGEVLCSSLASKFRQQRMRHSLCWEQWAKFHGPPQNLDGSPIRQTCTPKPAEIPRRLIEGSSKLLRPFRKISPMPMFGSLPACLLLVRFTVGSPGRSPKASELAD
jgi:hypothetical protein